MMVMGVNQIFGKSFGYTVGPRFTEPRFTGTPIYRDDNLPPKCPILILSNLFQVPGGDTIRDVKRLYQQKRERRASSASSHASSENSNLSNVAAGFGGCRKMTARERMRLEKQRRADEDAEQLRHLATENYAANRARTAARKEREANRPNILRQGTPSLEIKGIKPDSVRNHDSPRQSPKSRGSPSGCSGGITAIHPEPSRKRISSPKIHQNRTEVDRQLEAIERSLELAQAESLSKAIRESQGSVPANGNPPSSLPPGDNSDEDEIRSSLSSSPSSSSTQSITTPLEDPLDDQAPLDPLISTLSSSISTLNRGAFLATGAPQPEISENEEEEEEGSVLFETANDECVLDISELEMTNVSLIPESEEDANTFYSFEEFDNEEGGEKMRAAVIKEEERKKEERIFKRSPKAVRKKDKLNRSLPTTATHDLAITDLSFESDHQNRSLGDLSGNLLNISDQLNNSTASSAKSDYTKSSSTVILRSDRIRTLRQKCQQKLGPDMFHKIHNYLSEARFGEEVVPEEVIVGNLRQWVPDLVSDCFLVDQLIYLEKQELLARSVMCD
eukprot:sb/3463547/